MKISDLFKNINSVDIFSSIGDLVESYDENEFSKDEQEDMNAIDEEYGLYDTPAYVLCNVCHSRMPFDISDNSYKCPNCGTYLELDAWMNDDYDEDEGFKN